MAITINSIRSYTPANNDNYIVATSTNSGQPNFRLSLKVETFNGSTYDERFTALVPTRSDGNIVFNLKKILRTLVNQSLESAKHFSTFMGNTGVAQVRVSAQEYYGTPASLQGSASQQTFNVFAGWLDSYVNASFVPNDVLVSSGNTGKWLASTTEQDARPNQRLFLSGLIDAYTSVFERIQIKTYVGNTLSGTHNLTVSGISSKFFVFGFRLDNLNTLTSSTIFNDNITKVTFQGQTLGGVDKTNIYTVNVVRCPNKHDVYTLYWCNVFGAVQSMAMNGRPVNRVVGQRETAEFVDGGVITGNWGYNPLTGGEETINIERKNRYLLNSGLLSVNEFKRLKDCLTSYPLALQIGSTLFNCTLITSDLEEERQFPNPSNYQLEVELSKF
jgi:hypothetical protein